MVPWSPTHIHTHTHLRLEKPLFLNVSPLCTRVQIRMALKDWEDVLTFEKDAVGAQHLDAVFLLRQLLFRKAFHFTAMPALVSATRESASKRPPPYGEQKGFARRPHGRAGKRSAISKTRPPFCVCFFFFPPRPPLLRKLSSYLQRAARWLLKQLMRICSLRSQLTFKRSKEEARSRLCKRFVARARGPQELIGRDAMEVSGRCGGGGGPPWPLLA